MAFVTWPGVRITRRGNLLNRQYSRCFMCKRWFLGCSRAQKCCSKECENERRRSMGDTQGPGRIPASAEWLGIRYSKRGKLLKRQYRTCSACGMWFLPNDDGVNCCSKDCWKERIAANRPRYNCRQCGKVFVPKQATRKTFCSRECSFAHMAESRSPFHPFQIGDCSKIYPTQCKVCGGRFTARNKSYSACSRLCRLVRERIRSRKTFVSVRVTNSFRTLECKRCGNEFCTNYYADHRRFCSARCLSRFYAGGGDVKGQRRRLAQRQVQELRNAYVKKLIVSGTDLSMSDIPGWLVDLKRKQVMIKRMEEGKYEESKRTARNT